MFKKLFLPGGMVAAVILSFLFPEAGIWIKKSCGSSIFIILIFLVCGYQLQLKEMKFDRKFLAAFVLCALLSLCVAPWMGFLAGKVLCLDMLALTGLVVMASVPPTLSSGIVMAETAEGNVMLGVIMTVFYNLIGVLTMPLMLGWILSSGTKIETDPLKMFLQLLLFVVVPFLAGFGGRKLLKKKAHPLMGYIPSSCVILLILSFFSSAGSQFKTYPVKVLLLAAVAAVVMRVGILLILWYGGKLLKMSVEDRKAAIFTAGSKTLTIALTLLAILKIGDGPAVIPCMVFYFLQSMIDATLAGKMGISAQREAEKARKNAA